MGCRFYIIILVVVQFCDLSVGQHYCTKFDFNRPRYPELSQCRRNLNPEFMSMEYSLHNDIKPYRPTSRYFLSNGFTEFSCDETNITLTINPNTVIEAAIFLKTVDKSFVEILIYDADQNRLVETLRRTGTLGWTIFRGSIKSNILRARVRKCYTFSYAIFIIPFLT